MYITRQFGNVVLNLHPALEGSVALSDFCSSAATVDFRANDGFLLNNAILFSLSSPGFDLEAKIQDGMVFIKRNQQYQHSERCQGPGPHHVAIQWDTTSVGCGVAPWSGNSDAMSAHIRLTETPPTKPPLELVRKLRTEGLLFNSAYRNVDDLFTTVLDCLHLCETDIRRLGGQRLVWGKGGQQDRPLDEPEITIHVATFLASLGASRNFDVTCEPVAGSGKVDFWIVGPVHGKGLGKIAIEAKKAESADLVHGFSVQLPAYMSHLEADRGIFLTYWLKSAIYPKPMFSSYADLEMKILHPLPRGPGIRTVGIDLSNGPPPSRA